MKKIFAVALVLMFVGAASTTFAARVECEVTGVEGDMVTLKCEDADKFKKGDELKIRTPKKGAAVEGC
ncbi:MAG: hypothetical protein P8X39_01350 [Desulfofustis sp.]|jgi:hypothetical protein